MKEHQEAFESKRDELQKKINALMARVKRGCVGLSQADNKKLEPHIEDRLHMICIRSLYIYIINYIYISFISLVFISPLLERRKQNSVCPRLKNQSLDEEMDQIRKAKRYEMDVDGVITRYDTEVKELAKNYSRTFRRCVRSFSSLF